MLYDGCLLNNLPVDLMREEIETGLLVAVDVVPPVDLDVHATELENPSGWRLAWSRISPFAKPIEIPDIVSIINRAGVLGSIQSAPAVDRRRTRRPVPQATPGRLQDSRLQRRRRGVRNRLHLRRDRDRGVDEAGPAAGIARTRVAHRHTIA